MTQFLARRYADVVDVTRRDGEPDQFLWRGRLYVVRAVLAHWLESGAWWTGSATLALVAGADAPPEPAVVDDAERELWRVEASAGRAAGVGVYDLCFDWVAGAWSVAAVLD